MSRVIGKCDHGSEEAIDLQGNRVSRYKQIVLSVYVPKVTIRIGGYRIEKSYITSRLVQINFSVGSFKKEEIARKKAEKGQNFLEDSSRYEQVSTTRRPVGEFWTTLALGLRAIASQLRIPREEAVELS